MATTVSIKSLLEAGVHFGHQTRRWNPKMKPYIFGERNGIYILDLKKTLYAIDDAYSFLLNLGAAGKKVLFVGTKKQAQEPIKTAAERCGMPYVNYRWMGGMLTNFATIRTRVQRMEEIEAMKADGRFDAYTKKEQAGLNKEHTKLELALGGIRNMHDLPDALFIVDTKHEDNAVREAHRLHIPIIGLIDTNADPDDIDYGIPANDDAIRSVNLLCQLAADALIAGSGTVVTEQEMTADADKEVPAIPEEPEISERVEVSESTIKEIEEKTEEVAE